jgi:hypothetical protein
MIPGLAVLILVSGLNGQDLTGEEIIQKVNDLLNVSTSYARSKMTITTTSGQKRTFLSESWSKDKGEKSRKNDNTQTEMELLEVKFNIKDPHFRIQSFR